MDAVTALKAELEAWCEAYVAAFSAYDTQAISAHWSFPALIVQSGRTLSFKTPEHFSANTDMLLGFYRRVGVDRAVRDVVDFLRLDAETVSMTVADKMLDAKGDVITIWTAAYVLQKVNGNWRAILALAGGETAAWAARGTPLGRG